MPSADYAFDWPGLMISIIMVFSSMIFVIRLRASSLDLNCSDCHYSLEQWISYQ